MKSLQPPRLHLLADLVVIRALLTDVVSDDVTPSHVVRIALELLIAYQTVVSVPCAGLSFRLPGPLDLRRGKYANQL